MFRRALQHVPVKHGLTLLSNITVGLWLAPEQLMGLGHKPDAEHTSHVEMHLGASLKILDGLCSCT